MGDQGVTDRGDRIINYFILHFFFQVERPAILPQKQVVKKPYRRAVTPLPPKANSGVIHPSRPQTSLGLYNDKEGTFDVVSNVSRPNSAFGNNNERSPNVYKISRYCQ